MKESVLFFLFLILLVGLQAQNNEEKIAHIDSLMDLAVDLPFSELNIVLWEDIHDLSREIDYGEGLDYALNDLGLYYNTIGLHTHAISVFQELYDYGKLKGNRLYIIDAYFGLSRSYMFLDLLVEADEYFEKVIETSQEIRDSSILGEIYFDTGLYYLERENYHKAIDYFNDSKRLQEKVDSINYFPTTNYNLGIAYVKTGAAKRAIPYFEEYLKYIKSEKDSLNLADAYGYLAWAFQHVGLFDKAFVYYDSSLYHSALLNLDEVTFITYADMSEAYELKEDYETSLDYYKKYHNLKDSIVSFRTKRQVSEMKVKFETEEKEKELAIKEKKVSELQVTRQRILFLVAGLVASLIIIIWFFLKKRGDTLRKQKLLEIEGQLIRTQLENKELIARKLQNELENKERDLTNLALDIARKNEFFTNLTNKLEGLSPRKNEFSKSGLRDIVLDLNNHLRINEDLALLQNNVNEINQSFYQKLDQRFDNLSTNDKYALGLIRLNLSNKDLATIKGISSGSAKVLRYRLRKKLQLTPDIDLVYFLQNF